MKLRPPPPRFPILKRPLDRLTSWRVGREIRELPYTDQELITSLTNSLKSRVLELEQRTTVMGKLLTLFVTPDSPDQIQIDGVRLNHLYRLARVEPGRDVDVNEDHQIGLQAFKELLQRAEKAVGPIAPQSGHRFRIKR